MMHSQRGATGREFRLCLLRSPAGRLKLGGLCSASSTLFCSHQRVFLDIQWQVHGGGLVPANFSVN